MWVVATAVWASDLALCRHFLEWKVPVFHALWHILSSLGVCISLNIVLYLEMEAKKSPSRKMPVLLKSYPKVMGYFAYQYLDFQLN